MIRWNGIYVCIFGDKELYTPTITAPDWEETDEKVAREWFEKYQGIQDIDDEDIDDEDMEDMEDIDDDYWLTENYQVWQRYFEDGEVPRPEYVQSFDTFEQAQKFADGLNQDPNCDAWVKELKESKKVMEAEDIKPRLDGDETYVARNSSGYKSIGLIVNNKTKQFQIINGQVMTTDSSTKKTSKKQIRDKAQQLYDKGYKEYNGYGSIAQGVIKKTEAEDMTQVKNEIEKARAEDEDATKQELGQIKGSLNVLKTDEEEAISGYETFVDNAKDVVDDKLADALDDQMDEIIQDEKDHIEKLDTIKSALDESKKTETMDMEKYNIEQVEKALKHNRAELEKLKQEKDYDPNVGDAAVLQNLIASGEKYLKQHKKIEAKSTNKKLDYKLDGFKGVNITVVDKKNNINAEDYMEFYDMEYGIDEWEFKEDVISGIKDILTNTYKYADAYDDDVFTEDKIKEVADNITDDVLQLYDDLPEEKIDRKNGYANLSEGRYIVYDYADGDTMQDEEEKGLEPSQFTIYDNETDDFYYDELGNNPVFDTEEDAKEYIKKNLTELNERLDAEVAEVEYAVNVKNKETNKFIYQYDVYETYAEAEKSAKSIQLKDNEIYEILEVKYDEYGNELGVNTITDSTLEESKKVTEANNYYMTIQARLAECDKEKDIMTVINKMGDKNLAGELFNKYKELKRNQSNLLDDIVYGLVKYLDTKMTSSKDVKTEAVRYVIYKNEEPASPYGNPEDGYTQYSDVNEAIADAEEINADYVEKLIYKNGDAVDGEELADTVSVVWKNKKKKTGESKKVEATLNKFQTMTTDKNGNEVLLKDVSYNNACSWLEKELAKAGSKVVDTETKGNKTIIKADNKTKFEYDEDKGTLKRLEETKSDNIPWEDASNVLELLYGNTVYATCTKQEYADNPDKYKQEVVRSVMKYENTDASEDEILNNIIIRQEDEDLLTEAEGEEKVDKTGIENTAYELGYAYLDSVGKSYNGKYYEIFEDAYECPNGLTLVVYNDTPDKNGDVSDEEEVVSIDLDRIIPYKGLIAEIDEINPETDEENIVFIYNDMDDYVNGDYAEQVSLGNDDIVKRIKDYIDGEDELKDLEEAKQFLGESMIEKFKANKGVKTETKKLNETAYTFLTPDTKDMFKGDKISVIVTSYKLDPKEADVKKFLSDNGIDIKSLPQEDSNKILNQRALTYSVKLSEVEKKSDGYSMKITGSLQNICNFLADRKVDIDNFIEYNTDYAIMLDKPVKD